MKKVFAIIAILVVLVGAVFATGAASATLNIRSNVTKRFPGFKLEGIDQEDTSNIATANDAIRGATVSGNYTAWAAETDLADANNPATHGTYTDQEAVLNAINSIAENDIIVYFRLYQSGSEGWDDQSNKYYAKSGNTYQFTIEVGNMTLLNSGIQVANPTANQTVAPVDALTESATIDFTKASTVSGNAITITDGAANSGYTFQAVYNGIVYDDQDIGSFKVKWAHNANLEEGDYEATVKVTIAYN